jgi:uncharacterized membrane protein YdfJ with MMPL/SSD domain
VGDGELGPEAHRYYDTLTDRLRQDTEHVQHVHDFWGDMITAAGVQSSDGKAAYVQLNLAAIRAALRATNRWTRSARSSTTPRRRPACTSMSPARLR